MNAELVKQEINKIVETYRKNDYRGGRSQYPASKRDINRAQELGILEFIPNAPYEKHIGGTEMKLILKSAEDGGQEVGGMIDGEGDVTTTSASALYKAIHEESPTDDENPQITLSAEDCQEIALIIRNIEIDKNLMKSCQGEPRKELWNAVAVKRYVINQIKDGIPRSERLSW